MCVIRKLNCELGVVRSEQVDAVLREIPTDLAHRLIKAPVSEARAALAHAEEIASAIRQSLATRKTESGDIMDQ
jgi:hypothetical protein